MKRAVCESAPSCINFILSLFCRWGMQTGVRISFEYLKAFRLPFTTTHCFLSFFVTFKITPRMIKMLYLHIFQADSTENWNAFCKLIVLDNYKISKKSKTSVLRYIENITGSVGNFVKCILVDQLANLHSVSTSVLCFTPCENEIPAGTVCNDHCPGTGTIRTQIPPSITKITNSQKSLGDK